MLRCTYYYSHTPAKKQSKKHIEKTDIFLTRGEPFVYIEQAYSFRSFFIALRPTGRPFSEGRKDENVI
jgi:hypothetical protein